ncbi:uncharacterized protein K452DRAFT_334684 [Aplosporella prunicola CBS 121167]|uniref:Uncharacterized protein n=1 Tax=Aplosporella prunicola CBS 121167 TaxID=1176127 RepID=A0A6A6BAM9_9PEZI|nr:uncharacterized protein K452DRAFT_334684 [Aplosporella prunicola CBS 121167]KAF2141150.1 hypothetical protein K452DRAFT_334684 [Aplosporella prunicola CBS 121167]
MSCQGHTIQGRRCLNSARPGSEWCSHHDLDIAKAQCGGETKENRRCKKLPMNGKQFCDLHNPERTQCKAFTVTRERCLRRCRSGEKFCGHHNNPPGFIKSDLDRSSRLAARPNPGACLAYTPTFDNRASRQDPHAVRTASSPPLYPVPSRVTRPVLTSIRRARDQTPTPPSPTVTRTRTNNTSGGTDQPDTLENRVLRLLQTIRSVQNLTRGDNLLNGHAARTSEEVARITAGLPARSAYHARSENTNNNRGARGTIPARRTHVTSAPVEENHPINALQAAPQSSTLLTRRSNNTSVDNAPVEVNHAARINQQAVRSDRRRLQHVTQTLSPIFHTHPPSSASTARRAHSSNSNNNSTNSNNNSNSSRSSRVAGNTSPANRTQAGNTPVQENRAAQATQTVQLSDTPSAPLQTTSVDNASAGNATEVEQHAQEAVQEAAQPSTPSVVSQATRSDADHPREPLPPTTPREEQVQEAASQDQASVTQVTLRNILETRFPGIPGQRALFFEEPFNQAVGATRQQKARRCRGSLPSGECCARETVSEGQRCWAHTTVV